MKKVNTVMSKAVVTEKPNTKVLNRSVNLGMAASMAEAKARLDLGKHFRDDVDVLEALNNAAYANGFYKEPTRQSVVFRTTGTKLVLRYENKAGDNVVMSISMGVDGIGARHVVLLTFLHEEGSLEYNTSSLTLKGNGLFKVLLEEFFSDRQMARVKDRTARRYFRALKTDTPVTELK